MYSFHDTETDEQYDMLMKIADREAYLKKNPHIKQIITKAPSIGDPHRMGIVKTPDSFNSLLKHIKKGNSKGITDSTIKTR
tara:strand:+ start:197 stop:439 length:243 start_codon:yes stop_codon:yes gene_type:complete